jgi:beta-1,4-mannosyltransferase
LTERRDRHLVSIMAFHRRGNSYLDCFYPPLEELGVNVCDAEFSGKWLLKHLRNVDYIHLHWPSTFYHASRRRECFRNFGLLLFLLLLAQWRGVHLIWTVHNLYPHDRCIVPRLDILTRRLLTKCCELFFVHSPSAEAAVLREFPAVRGRIVLINHGHWMDYYPHTVSRSTARSQLGLAESEFVFLFLGLCKPYKNLEGLIRAFDQLPGNPVLVIAGKFQDQLYEAAIRAAICRCRNRIVLHSGFVAHDDIQVYLRSANVLVTPYNEVLSSGSAILGLSFGRPVVAPAIGCLKDLIVEGCGFLYNPLQPEGLRDAMIVTMNVRFDEVFITAEASKLDWRESARIVKTNLAISLKDADAHGRS